MTRGRREMLRILNYFAAPFGSMEGHLLRYGVEGTDYNYDDKGNPQLTDQGKSRSRPGAASPRLAGLAAAGKSGTHPRSRVRARLQGYEKLSRRSASKTPRSARSRHLRVQGHRPVRWHRRRRAGHHRRPPPLSDWDSLIQEWRNNGGTQVKNELAESCLAHEGMIGPFSTSCAHARLVFVVSCFGRPLARPGGQPPLPPPLWKGCATDRTGRVPASVVALTRDRDVAPLGLRATLRAVANLRHDHAAGGRRGKERAARTSGAATGGGGPQAPPTRSS